MEKLDQIWEQLSPAERRAVQSPGAYEVGINGQVHIPFNDRESAVQYARSLVDFDGSLSITILEKIPEMEDLH